MFLLILENIFILLFGRLVKTHVFCALKIEETMSFIDLFDFIGTFFFAMSGTLAATSKRMDWFGAMFIGFVTAVGGGTVRDLLMGITPVSWIQTMTYTYCILAAVIIALFFRRHVMQWRKTMFLFDTIGIGVFTIIGLEKALNADILPALSVMMGLSTAVVGGVLRDTLCNDIPLIFKKEIYATACLAGAIIFLIMRRMGVPSEVSQSVTIGVIITIRLIAIRQNWSFPRFEDTK